MTADGRWVLDPQGLRYRDGQRVAWPVWAIQVQATHLETADPFVRVVLRLLRSGLSHVDEVAAACDFPDELVRTILRAAEHKGWVHRTRDAWSLEEEGEVLLHEGAAPGSEVLEWMFVCGRSGAVLPGRLPSPLPRDKELDELPPAPPHRDGRRPDPDDLGLRVRLNRIRTRQGVLDIEIADDSKVEEKRQQLRRTNPLEAGIYVHGAGEAVRLHDLNIDADNAESDGKALRLACGTAANVGLHYLGEGESANYATAKEMGEPTSRYYSERQDNFTWILRHLVTAAYRRYCVVTATEWPESSDLQLVVSVAEVARADNESLARSANFVVRALVQMSDYGWIDDETATRLAFQFAGEPLGTDEIAEILAKSTKPDPDPETETDQ